MSDTTPKQTLREAHYVTDKAAMARIKELEKQLSEAESKAAEWEHRAVGGTCRILSDPQCDCSLCVRDKAFREIRTRLAEAESRAERYSHALRDGGPIPYTELREQLAAANVHAKGLTEANAGLAQEVDTIATEKLELRKQLTAIIEALRDEKVKLMKYVMTRTAALIEAIGMAQESIVPLPANYNKWRRTLGLEPYQNAD